MNKNEPEVCLTPRAPRNAERRNSEDEVNPIIPDDSKLLSIQCLQSRLRPKYEPNAHFEVQIAKLLGHGSYGSVYLIHNTAFVIKLLWDTGKKTYKRPHDCLEYVFWERVLEKYPTDKDWPTYWCEIKLIGITTRAIRLDKRWFQRGTPFLIMPFYYRWDDIVQTNLSPHRHFTRAWYIWSVVLEALCYLQREWNMVHLDVKLGNIMIDPQGGIRVIDFGMIEPYMPGQLFPTFQPNRPRYNTESLPLLHHSVQKELYYVWPPGVCFLSGIMGYSSAVVQFELIYGKSVFQFQGTRSHWQKYISDLEKRGFPRRWIDLLVQCSSATTQICILSKTVKEEFERDNAIDPTWRDVWNDMIQQNIAHQFRWNQETLLDFYYNEEEPELISWSSSSSHASPSFSFETNSSSSSAPPSSL